MTNTTPFWASILAYCYAHETISLVEAIAMVLSFAAVILITVEQSEDETDEPKHERLIFKDNDALAGLIGCLCVIGQGFINGVVSVQTRMI